MKLNPQATFSADIEFAQQLDEQDILRLFRKRFRIPVRNGKEQIYFLGNSLGLQPVAVKDAVMQVMDQWADYGVEGFFEGEIPWMNYHDLLRAPLCKIIGALPHEINVMNQLTINLHLMMVSFYRPSGKRNKIICEAKAFPSDQYMLETHIRYHGFDPSEIIIEVQPRDGEYCIRTEDIISTIEKHSDELAMVLWGGVNYYTGQVFDIPAITKAAHTAGAIAGFDMAHGAGNIELKLHDWNIDFACWCNYKYLNSGPATIGSIFINERHHDDYSLNRFAGWWGYDKATRFNMEKGFKPEAGADGWQLSAPSMMLCAAHKASLEIFDEAGMDNIISKGKMLADYLMYLLMQFKEDYFEIITPREHGCQVSMLMKNNGKEIFNQLERNEIFADWREPDVIRVAPVPLYNTFLEVWKFAELIKAELQK